MDWRKLAEEELSGYQTLVNQCESLRRRIAEKNAALYDLTAVQYRHAPVQGNSTDAEARRLQQIEIRDDLLKKYEQKKKQIARIQRSLQQLPEEQQQVLRLCYIERYHGYLARAMEKLHCAKTEVYRKRNKAMEMYTLYQFGVSSLAFSGMLGANNKKTQSKKGE